MYHSYSASSLECWRITVMHDQEPRVQGCSCKAQTPAAFKVLSPALTKHISMRAKLSLVANASVLVG
jgi:hypothetical protein